MRSGSATSDALLFLGYIHLATVDRPAWLSSTFLAARVRSAGSCLQADPEPTDCAFMADLAGAGAHSGTSVALAAPRAACEALIEDLRIETHPCDRYLKAAATDARQATGHVIGYEVLGYEWGRFHSWLCHSLEVEIDAGLGIRPRPDGLFADLPSACAVAAYVNALGDEVEPVTWLPFGFLELAHE